MEIFISKLMLKLYVFISKIYCQHLGFWNCFFLWSYAEFTMKFNNFRLTSCIPFHTFCKCWRWWFLIYSWLQIRRRGRTTTRLDSICIFTCKWDSKKKTKWLIKKVEWKYLSASTTYIRNSRKISVPHWSKKSLQ